MDNTIERLMNHLLPYLRRVEEFQPAAIEYWFSVEFPDIKWEWDGDSIKVLKQAEKPL